MNSLTNKFIVVAAVVLVFLVFITILLTQRLRKPQEAKKQIPVPTTSFEPPRRVETKQQKMRQLSQKTDDLLTSHQLENLNKLKEKSPFSSDNFVIKYSPDLNRFFIAKKTPQADEKIKQFLKENNVLDIYEGGHPLFLITDKPVDQAINEVQNELFEVVGEKDDSETVPPQPTEKKADKDLKRITNIMRTLFSFDLGEINLSPTPAQSLQAPENLGNLTCPPNLGKPNSLGYYQMPEPQNDEYVFSEGAALPQRYGKKEMLCVLYTVALNYKSAFPKSRLRIGDINDACYGEHETHNYGVGVDVTESIGGNKGPAAYHEFEDGSLAGKQNPAYNDEARSRTIELGKLFINTKLIRNIFFDDSVVIQALNSYVRSNDIPAEKGDVAFYLEDHGDHFHIDLLASLRGPDERNYCR